jgi:hypothetical protein
MTQRPSDERDTPPTAPPLEYGRRASGLPYGWQAALGAMISCGTILGAAFAGMFMGGMAGVILAPLLLAIGFALVAVAYRGYERSRGWAVGFLIGIGVAVLLDGLCWVAVANMRIGG